MTDLIQLAGSSPAKAESQLSFIKLVQGSSIKRVGRPGQLVDNATGVVYDSLDVVLIGAKVDRSWFDPKETHSDKPLCRSSDGQKPDPDVTAPQAASCMECQHVFEKHIDSKGNLIDRKFCKRAQMVPVIAAQTQKVHMVPFHGVSEDVVIKAWKRLQEERATTEVEYANEYTFYLQDFYFRLSGRIERNFAVYVLDGPWLIPDGAVFGPHYAELLQSLQEREVA